MNRVLSTTIAVIALAGSVASQTSAHDWVILAEQALANDENQAAAKFAMQGLEAARKVGHAKTRKELIKTYTKLLRKADKLHARAESAERVAAREAKKIAKLYKKIGWYETALEALVAVAEFSDDIEERDIESIERLLAKKKPVSASAPKLGKDRTSKFFATRDEAASSGAWTEEKAEITVPGNEKPALLIGKSELAVPYRLAVEAKVERGAGKAGLVFGYKAPDNYWKLTVRHLERDTEYALTHVSGTESAPMLRLVRKRENRPSPDWSALEIGVTQAGIELAVGELESRKVSVGRVDLSGRCGLVSLDQGSSKASFRKLR